MGTEIKRGLLFTIVTMALFGFGYHGLMWLVGRAFASSAEGSLIVRDGRVIGSSLIAQKFTRPEYFASRPSAVDYNAAGTGGSNWSNGNPDHLKAVRDRLDSVVAREGVTPSEVPSEMVTASGAGMDPHIPPNAAELQVARVAGARGVDAARIRELVREHTEGPSLGVFGRERVNVLQLNLALDRTFGVLGSAK